MATLTEVRAKLPKIDDSLWDKIAPLELFLVTKAFGTRPRRPREAYSVRKKHDSDKKLNAT